MNPLRPAGAVRLGRRAVQLALLLSLAILPQLAGAAERTAGLVELRDWTLSELTWRDRAGLPSESTFTGPLAAYYNMAFGATVLGVNLLAGGNEYYAACVSCSGDQLKALAYLGPLRQPVQWRAGPYFLAAGLGDGRLVVWLTAPREYPRLVTVSSRYEPNTPFACRVAPPEPPSAEWERWTATAAYLEGGLQAGLVVATVDGNGRALETLPALEVYEPLDDVVYAALAVGERRMPAVLLADAEGLYWASYGEPQGWRGQPLAGSGISDVQLYLGATAAPPYALAWFDEEDYHGGRRIQRIDLDSGGGQGPGVRWGPAGVLPRGLEPLRLATVDSTRSAWPLLAVASTADIHLFYRSAAADPRLRQLQLSSVQLHSGDRLAAAGDSPAAYPILAVAAAAHWQSGDPEVYWVQFGSLDADGGQLYRLAYEPPAP